MNKPGLGLLERQHQLCRSLALINPRRPSVQVAELGSVETPGKPIQRNPRGRIQRSRALNHDGHLAARYCFASTWASIRAIKASAGAALRASFSGLASHRMLE